MRCPQCNSAWSKVYRTMKIMKVKIRRYRTCQHCQFNFSTTEEANVPKVKRDRKTEDDIIIIEDDEEY